jgi:hypothetical protein
VWSGVCGRADDSAEEGDARGGEARLRGGGVGDGVEDDLKGGRGVGTIEPSQRPKGGGRAMEQEIEQEMGEVSCGAEHSPTLL